MNKPPGRRRGFLGLRKPVGSRTPQDSKLYTRVLPVLIVIMAVVMVALILVALGVLLGLIPFQ